MKLSIDFEKKIIAIENRVNIGELIENLKKLLPDSWQTFELDTNVNWNWSNPIYIERWIQQPWWTNGVTYTNGTINCLNVLNEDNTITQTDYPTTGTYCFEIK